MRLSLLLSSIILFGGCFNPDYVTKHSVAVFCECPWSCPSQPYLEHAIDFMISQAPLTHGWFTAGTDIKYDMLYWVPEAQFCGQSPEGCDGTIRKTKLGWDIYLRYEEGEKISQTAIFREFFKHILSASILGVDYQSDEWRRIDEVYEAYIPVEAEFLGE